jgi:DNA-binding transcriptional LysR family regulator
MLRITRKISIERPKCNWHYSKAGFVKCEGKVFVRFDLADLSLFRHVVEAGSITHGAERANLALAAASTRISNMEETLGVALLTRGRAGVTPTQAGRTLLQHARAILRQAERLHEDLGAYGGGLAGQIRVLSNTNALTEFLPEALSSFLAAHPSVSVDLEERLSDEIVGLIAEGVADLGIVAGTVDARALETYPFRRDRFVLVVAREHALAKRAKIGFEDVLDHDFVGLDRASALQRFLASKAVRIGRPLRLRVQLRSFDAVCRLVECKVGIGIVPQTTAQRVAKTMAIAIVPLTDAWAVRELTICIRNMKELPLYARQLVEHLRHPGISSQASGIKQRASSS